MSTTLYRKYRPQKFSDVIGQKYIVQTLTNALTNDRLGQAYLFTGPRGTGKTTLARLLAKSINCSSRTGSEPCLTCPHCLAMAENRSLDIIEIDAASNTGVDNIRELRETVKLPPTLGTHKIYIIDEVHMLSSGAWNALLKTLEEPPSHVVFILATTELHKIPETILSRCQRFDFARLPLEHIVEKLAKIAETEQVSVDHEALEIIALTAEGGMRDAESLLSQVLSLEDKHVTAEEAANILGVSPHKTTETFSLALAQRNFSQALDILRQLTDTGSDCFAFATQLLHYFRKLLVVTIDTHLSYLFKQELTQEQLDALLKISALLQPADAIRLVELFQAARKEIRLSPLPELPLEVAAAKFIHPDAPALSLTTPPTKQTSSNPLTAVTPTSQSIPNKEVQQPLTTNSTPHTTQNTTPSSQKSESENTPIISLEKVRAAWPAIVEAAKRKTPSLALALVGSHPLAIEGTTVSLSAKFSIHKEQLSQAKSQLTLSDAFDTILKIRPKIKIILEGTPLQSSTTEQSSTEPILDQVLTALGGHVIQPESVSLSSE